ncbi:MAG: DUF4013 domain-containing protein [Chloroflexota bacterium]
MSRNILHHMTLREALSNIHRDPHWWRKVGIGGALALTIIGIPWPVGTTIVSLENTLKGFPYPLPPWNDWGTRYIIGFFTILLDLVLFGFPLMFIGLFACCVLAISTLSANPAATGWVVTTMIGIVIAFQLLLFTLSICPISRLIFLREGRIEDAMGMRPFREALHPEVRRTYLRIRLRSLPVYLPFLLCVTVLLLTFQLPFSGAGIVGFILVWLSLSSLFYAHLAVAQLYATINISRHN